jgi:hypothetical protein
MLTPPHYCIQGALRINHATCCFDTSNSRYAAAESGFRRVLLPDNKHKRQSSRRLTVTKRAWIASTETAPGLLKSALCFSRLGHCLLSSLYFRCMHTLARG